MIKYERHRDTAREREKGEKRWPKKKKKKKKKMEKGRREGNRRSGRDRAQRRNGGDRECQVLRMNNRVDVFRRNVSPEINAHGIFYNGAPGWVAVSDFFFFYEPRSARAFPRYREAVGKMPSCNADRHSIF